MRRMGGQSRDPRSGRSCRFPKLVACTIATSGARRSPPPHSPVFTSRTHAGRPSPSFWHLFRPPTENLVQPRKTDRLRVRPTVLPATKRGLPEEHGPLAKRGGHGFGERHPYGSNPELFATHINAAKIAALTAIRTHNGTPRAGCGSAGCIRHSGHFAPCWPIASS